MAVLTNKQTNAPFVCRDVLTNKRTNAPFVNRDVVTNKQTNSPFVYRDVLGSWKIAGLSRDTLRQRNDRAASPLVSRGLDR